MEVEHKGHVRSLSDDNPPSPSNLQFVRSHSTEPSLVRETSFAVRKLDSFVFSKPLTEVDSLEDEIKATEVDDEDVDDDDDDDL